MSIRTGRTAGSVTAHSSRQCRTDQLVVDEAAARPIGGPLWTRC